jgi:tripartite-type tricarboxylate transporter receptor subunit TctC
MSKSTLRLLQSVLFAAACVCAGQASWAQDAFPQKPVRMVVGLPAGGPSDLLARTIAEGLATTLGKPIVVENRAGAGGVVGAEAVAKSAADGYTIYFAAMPAIVFVPLLYDKLPYDQARDFTPIGSIAGYSLYLLLNPQLPVKTLPELVSYAKKRPGELTYASGGNGTSNHLAGELLKSMAGIDLVHVPYKGNVTAQQDVIAGRVSMMFDFWSTAQQQVKAGRLTVLGSTGDTRSSFTPEVPTFKEGGIGNYSITAWFGLFAPAATPKPIVDKLNAELRAALALPAIQQKLAQQGYEAMPGSPADLQARVDADNVLWTPVFRKANIRAD